jgi:hypothetical protein
MPDVPWSNNSKIGAERVSTMFKPLFNAEENKGARTSKENLRRRSRREEVLMKKRALAAQKVAAVAAAREQEATSREQEATRDADLNNRIDEIENDMQETFEEFQTIGTMDMDVLDVDEEEEFQYIE